MNARVLALAPIIAALLSWSGSGDRSAALGRHVQPQARRSTTDTVVGSTYDNLWGHIVVGPNRHSLYMFCITGTRNCPGRPSRGWRPLIGHGRVVAAPHSRIKASKLGTAKLDGGRRQVTYYGHRLYFYSGDRKPGQINGQAKHEGRGYWFLIWAINGEIANTTTY